LIVRRSRRLGALFDRECNEATMYHLLVASVALLILAVGAATSIATTQALQDWAVSGLDARTGTGERLGVAPGSRP
jgi:hypothetical protein